MTFIFLDLPFQDFLSLSHSTMLFMFSFTIFIFFTFATLYILAHSFSSPCLKSTDLG